MKSSVNLFIIIFSLVWSFSEAQVQPKTLPENTASNPVKTINSPGPKGTVLPGGGSSGTAVGGRGVIVGSDGGAFKTGRSSVRVNYDSNVVDGVIKAKKAKKGEAKDQPPAEEPSAVIHYAVQSGGPKGVFDWHSHWKQIFHSAKNTKVPLRAFPDLSGGFRG